MQVASMQQQAVNGRQRGGDIACYVAGINESWMQIARLEYTYPLKRAAFNL